MNNMPLVSVIIPAYNTETYIGEMLQCTVNQTYQNIEILVIDDGSTDGTKKIVVHYQLLDSRITLIESDHSGVSRARNIGIDHAKGKYLFFWDSDDLIEPEAIEKAVHYALSNHIDSVLYGYSHYANGKKGVPRKHEIHGIYENARTVNELIPHFIGHSFLDINEWIKGKKGLRQGKEHTALWRMMVNSETIKNHSIRFDTSLTLGEDTKFINQYFLYEKRIGFLDECLYYLRWRTDGANMTSVKNPILAQKNKLKLIEARKQLDAIGRGKGVDLHCFWEGTMVFSAVELALKLSHNRRADGKDNKKAFLDYINTKDVQDAIHRFKPAGGIRSIPFRMLRTPNLLWLACKLLPQRMIDQIL